MGMELSLKRKFLREESRKFGPSMSEIPQNQWPSDPDPTRAKVWRSNKFLAQLFLEVCVDRLSICRTELNNQGGWKDGISWEELQLIKSQCGFGHLDAVEIYPPDADVVNVANMRHLWLLSIALPFGWHSVEEEDEQQRDDSICATCNGSGEGPADRTRCHMCQGSGCVGGWRNARTIQDEEDRADYESDAMRDEPREFGGLDQ